MQEPLARPGQLLTNHLTNVGNDVGQYLASIDGPIELGKLVGYLHDFGKFTPAWQDYIHGASLRGRQNILPHAIHGALQAWFDWENCSREVAIAMSLVILGHHTGLNNVYGSDGLLTKLNSNRSKLDEISALPVDFDLSLDNAIDSLSQNLPIAHNWLVNGNPLALSLKIRYLFSALVTSDRNDAANCERDIPESLWEYPAEAETLDVLWQKLSDRVNSLVSTDKIDLLRAEFWQECTNSRHRSGWIAVEGPCGIGKTYSLMGLALVHALQQNKTRIIYCAPLNTMLDRTLADYENIFKGSVISHFYAVDSEDFEDRDRFTEQWQHPIVVTSMMQLFESLFSHLPTPSRKLANIANSVIILDEVQSIPTHYLSPILATLQGLIDELSCTVILSSVTLPSYDRWQIAPQPAISQVDRYYQKLTRVHYHQRGVMNWIEIGTEINEIDCPQVIVGVQTVAAARAAYTVLVDLMPNVPVMLLTGKMPPIDRQEILESIQTKLDLKFPSPIVLIATTCIQSIDISFASGYFEQIGVDGVIQFAGRVNRNREYGKQCDVHVFKTADRYNLPPGDLMWRQSITETLIHLGYSLDDDRIVEEYTNRLFDRINTDERGIIPMLLPDRLNFRDASNAFKLISPAIPIFVRLDRYRNIFDRALMQRDWITLDRFGIRFYATEIEKYRHLLQPIDSNKLQLGYLWIGEYDLGIKINS